MENKIPEYLWKLREEVNQASDRFVKATAEWERAKEAIKKHPGFVLTGERRSPKKGEDFLGEIGTDEDKPTRAYSDFLPDVPRFILRRVEEETGNEPEPRVVWACPAEVMERLGELKRQLSTTIKWTHFPDDVGEIISLCRSTREATVEEIEEAIVGAHHVHVECSHFPGRTRYEIALDAKKLHEVLQAKGLRIVREGE